MMNFRNDFFGRNSLEKSIVIDEDFDARELARVTAKQKKDLSDSGFEDMFSMKRPGPLS